MKQFLVKSEKQLDNIENDWRRNFKHAGILNHAEQIIRVPGKLTVINEQGYEMQFVIKNFEEIQDKLSTAIQEEEEAIAGYQKDAKVVDPKTGKLLREIARDEIHHKKQLATRLSQIR